MNTDKNHPLTYLCRCVSQSRDELSEYEERTFLVRFSTVSQAEAAAVLEREREREGGRET